eukprot:11821334-Heterocapsa_arctica.AAC.1
MKARQDEARRDLPGDLRANMTMVQRAGAECRASSSRPDPTVAVPTPQSTTQAGHLSDSVMPVLHNMVINTVVATWDETALKGDTTMIVVEDDEPEI